MNNLSLLAKSYFKLLNWKEYDHSNTTNTDVENDELVAELENHLKNNFWDCECLSHYIHDKKHIECPICGAEQDDMPDSIISEMVDPETVGNV